MRLSPCNTAPSLSVLERLIFPTSPVQLRAEGSLLGPFNGTFLRLCPSHRLAEIGSASRAMPKEATVLLRGAFDSGVRRKPQAFAADAVIPGGIMDFEYGPGIE